MGQLAVGMELCLVSLLMPCVTACTFPQEGRGGPSALGDLSDYLCSVWAC